MFNKNLVSFLALTLLAGSLSQANANEPRAVEMTAVVIKQGMKTEQRQFSVGDTITIRAFAEDPNGLPIQFKFGIAHNSGWSTLRNYSDSAELTYTFLPEDALANNIAFGVDVRNNDGQVNHLGADASKIIHGITVTDGVDRQPTKLSSFKLLVNGQESSQKQFEIGDQITLVAEAADPKGLPFEYKFSIAHNSGWTNLTGYTDSNEFTYVFSGNDALVEDIAFGVAVRNDDGKVDHLGQDDSKMIHDIVISDGVERLPTKLSAFQLLVNGVASNKKNFKVGDQITLVAEAKDPKNLPFQHQFSMARNSGWHNLNSYSSENELSYIFTKEDALVENIAFGVAVRNDDGKVDHLGQDDSKMIHDIVVSDGVSRQRPVINDGYLEIEMDRFLTKSDAVILLEEIKKDQAMAFRCGVITKRLGVFIANEDRQREQVLGLFANGVDTVSKECVDYVSSLLPALPDMSIETEALLSDELPQVKAEEEEPGLVDRFLNLFKR